MVFNDYELLELAPIKNMMAGKYVANGTSYGLGEVGYDIRIKQDVTFTRSGDNKEMWVTVAETDIESVIDFKQLNEGRFALASAIEEFQMPNNLVGIVHDKSTWARKGLSVFNTVIEPGWNGFLTLELVYHGNIDLIIPAGSGIAQVIFHKIVAETEYSGKYQNQANEPVPAKESI